MLKLKIKKLVHSMTLEEKVAITSGFNFWYIGGNNRLDIPKVMVADGPHGLRKQVGNSDHLGLEQSVTSICYPSGSLTAASFNRKTMSKLGEALGKEARSLNISTILGPSINIKRSPLCGRNFEYFSEDPLLSTELAENYIKAVQNQGVATSVKHFLANNQENKRMTSSSEVDERALREIYLASFEKAIIKGKPWTVMSSYNRLNGKYVGDSEEYLTNILRKEWGFDGVVMSDWGGVNDRVASLNAGLDIDMPGSIDVYRNQIIAAVHNDELSVDKLDEIVSRILIYIDRVSSINQLNEEHLLEKNHDVARQLCEDSIVLLKNKNNLLPISPKAKIAFVGPYASHPRYQGGGSSHINSYKIISALEHAKAKGLNIQYARGFDEDDDLTNDDLLNEALDLSMKADTVIVFVGLPDRYESEGYDRKHMRLPQNQNELIERIASNHPNVAVVLHNGSPVEMPWVDKVSSIVEAYLGGEAIGEAVVNILDGTVNPSGRLPESFPKKLEDNPSYLFYGGEGNKVEYREGIFVGYRYYVTKKQSVLFPFGHGLSYSTFKYEELKVSAKEIQDNDILKVSVKITNTSNIKGSEVVQLYVSPPKNNKIRPLIELRGFDKVVLKPSESKVVTFELCKRSFSYWEEKISDWFVDTGKYQIIIGNSCEESILIEEVMVNSTSILPVSFELNSTMGEVFSHPIAAKVFGEYMSNFSKDTKETQAGDAISDEMMAATMEAMPLRQLLSFAPGITYDELCKVINKINDAIK